jgi:predicted amidophosphoribosyltransferase
LDHYASFGPALPLRAGRIILVDEVVTRGSTALGAAWRLLEAMPDVSIMLLALARTVPIRPCRASWTSCG